MSNLRLNTGDTGNYVTSADDGSLYASIFGTNCYVTKIGSQFAASVQSNTEVRVLDGDAIINGRHCKLNPNEYDTVAITTGTSGYKRNDLIGIMYRNTDGVESAAIEVIEGTPTTTTPTDPSYPTNSILDGSLEKFCPLYRVILDGINITGLVKLFVVSPSLNTLTKQDVGLANVDNTPDANKSVRYAQSAAEATKAVQLKTSRKLITRGACIENSVDFNGTSDVILKVAIADESDYWVDVISDSHGNSVTAHFWRVGPMVFMTATGRLRIDATDIITSQSNVIPRRFRPSQNVAIAVAPYTNNQLADKIARVNYKNDGSVDLHLQPGFVGTYYFTHSGAWYADYGGWFGWLS